jgi:hypothetical protein
VILAAIACVILLGRAPVAAQPLVTGDLTIYYNFDSFTDVVMDGSGNGFNGKVRDSTRNMTDQFEIGQLTTTGVVSNDTSNPKRGAGAIRFTQSDVPGDHPVYLDMDGGVIKANHLSKVPSAAATYAAWVNLEPLNVANGWNVDASIVQGSTAGPGHAVPHLQAQQDGTFRLSLRDELSNNIANTSGGGSPWTVHPYTNQPAIDADPNTPPEPWPANQWFHLAATYDKNANGGAGEFALYYNGTKLRGGPANGTAGAVDLGAWDIRGIGQYYDGLGVGAVYDSGSRRLHGMMDELYIFTRALSEAEIQTLVNIAPPGVEGDYNADGRVDAADYVVWRKDPGAHGGDPGGYNTWRTNFGRMAAGASLSAVPEPGCFALASILIGGIVLRRHR